MLISTAVFILRLNTITGITEPETLPIEGEVSELEQEMIDLIRTEGKHKDYELVEYVNDVNREYRQRNFTWGKLKHTKIRRLLFVV